MTPLELLTGSMETTEFKMDTTVLGIITIITTVGVQMGQVITTTEESGIQMEAKMAGTPIKDTKEIILLEDKNPTPISLNRCRSNSFSKTTIGKTIAQFFLIPNRSKSPTASRASILSTPGGTRTELRMDQLNRLGWSFPKEACPVGSRRRQASEAVSGISLPNQ